MAHFNETNAFTRKPKINRMQANDKEKERERAASQLNNIEEEEANRKKLYQFRFQMVFCGDISACD